MNNREQLRPVYLDVNGDVIVVNSIWSDVSGEDPTYKLTMNGSREALSTLYPDSEAARCEGIGSVDENWEIIIQEKDYVFPGLTELRRWMRDLMVDWQDSGAMPTTAPEPMHGTDFFALLEESAETVTEETLSVPSVAVFETITELREAVHFKSTDESQSDIETREYSTEKKGAGEIQAEDEEQWSGSEVTMIPTSKSPDASPEEESWEGTEETAIPTSKDNDAWDGAEQTIVGGGNAADWDGSEGTVISQPAGEWLGDEGTMVGTAKVEEQPASGSTTTSTGSRTRTNPSFNDGWYLMGDKGPCTGEVWGDYELGGILGAGGMGTVYRGRQFSLRRRVAIKVLPAHLQSDAQMRERFELEAQSASVLNSPHVVQVFAAGTENGNPFYAMEFVEGCDLHDVVVEAQKKEEMIDPHVASDYIIQAGRGLIEAQKHDFVHRDIKPPNLMLTKKGTVKIADFGIVKVLGESSMTMTGSAIGTPAYSAPEQGSGTGCDGRSDIYALGVVFYELLTLQKPFDGTTGNALIYQHTYTEPPMLTDINPGCPESYQTVVLKCMQKNPDDRYQSAQELVDDLERVRLGTAPLAQVFGTGAEAMMKAQGLSRSSWKRNVIIAAAMVLSVIGYMIFSSIAASQAKADIRIASLKEKLEHLDNVESPEDSDVDYLNELKSLLNDDDTLRWSNKLTAITTMENSLRRLDVNDESSALVLTETREDYDKYIAAVGSTGQAAQRWQRKLENADQKIASARIEIAQDLKVTDQELNVIIWGRVLPSLAILEKMAGNADGDVTRWNARHKKFTDVVAELRASLSALDTDNAQFTEQQIGIMTTNLETLAPKVDSRDQDILRWRSSIGILSGGLENLRHKLAVFDAQSATPYASQMLIRQMTKDLAAYRPLVGKDDLSLQRWDKKIEDSQALMKAHSIWFVDRVEPVVGLLPVKVRLKARQRFNIIQPLFPDDDVNIEKWGDILSESKRRTEDMQKRLANVLQQEKISKTYVQQARATIVELEKIGGLVESSESYDIALRNHENYHADLREKLQAYNKVAPISKDMQDALREFTRFIGSDDEEGRVWRKKNAHYERIQSSLIVLDQSIEVPAGSREKLNELITLVNVNDIDVVRWKDKLDKLDDIESQLSVLSNIAPVPAGASELLKELVILTGDRYERIRAWRTKVDRVAELKSGLSIIEEAYVLPAGTDEKMTELLALVGNTDQEVIVWQPIMKRLVGPPRPSWASDFGRDEFGLYAEITIEDFAYRFRYVPSGKFNIGSAESEIERDIDEDQVPVTLTKGFWLAEQECIQTLWANIMWENTYPSKFVGGEHPVERISWEDTQVFLALFNEKVGLMKGQARLPYEAEWEYACRVGNESASFTDDMGQGTDVSMVAWHYDNSDQQTWPVKQRVNNALGLFDMHGNVWEWCEDHYGGYPPAGATDPKGGARKEHVIRGGSFYDYAKSCRSANRLGIDGNTRTMFVGFRIAITLDQDIEHNLEEIIEQPIVDDVDDREPQGGDREPDEKDVPQQTAVKEEDLELADSIP